MGKAVLAIVVVFVAVGAFVLLLMKTGGPATKEAELRRYESRAEAIERGVTDRRKAAGCDDETYENARGVLGLTRSMQDNVGVAKSKQRLAELEEKRVETDFTNAERDELEELHRRIGKLRADGYGRGSPPAQP